MGTTLADNMDLRKIIPDIDNTIEIQFIQFILRV